MIALRPSAHLFTLYFHQLSICYIVGLRDAANKNNDNHNNKKTLNHTLNPWSHLNEFIVRSGDKETDNLKACEVTTRKDKGTGVWLS